MTKKICSFCTLFTALCVDVMPDSVKRDRLRRRRPL